MIPDIRANKQETPTFMFTVRCCARCGKDHDPIPFVLLTNPPAGITHFGECPELNEPILMFILP